MTAVETTTPIPAQPRRTPPPAGLAPPPPAGLAPHTYRVGDRITYWCVDVEPPLRLVGDVTTTNTWLFDVRWLGGHGVGRFAHGHEPDTMRHATAADERAVTHRATLTAVAHELVRLADTHTVWPGEIRRALRARAAELTGGTR